MALSEQQKQEMKRDVFTIQTQEERQAVQLSKVGEKFSEDQRRLHNVKAAERDVLKINKILNHKEELTLKDEDHMDLVLRQNRNLNFLFMNQEKWSGDSLIMQEIKKTLRSYENLLHEKTNDSKSREELAGTAVAFCDELVSSCEAYLSRGRSFFFWRWGRFEAVNQLKQRMLEEKRLLSNLSTNEWTKSFGHVADGADSLRDLLNEHTIGGRLKKHQEAVKKNKKADEENPEHVLERREKTKEADVTYKSPIALTEEDLKEREEREKADKKKAVKERQENIRKAREKDEENPEHVLERREKTKEADVDYRNPIALTEEDLKEQEEREKEDKKKAVKERREQERIEKERLEQQRKQQEYLEKERLDREKREQEIERAKKKDEENPEHVLERREKTKEADVDYRNPIALTEEDLKEQEEREKEDKKKAVKERQENIRKAREKDEENPEHVLERREKTKEADVDYRNPIALTEEDLKEQEEREKADKKKAVREREEKIRIAREKDEENPEHVLERREKTKEADVTYKSPIALTEEDLKEQEEREKADKKKAVKEREEELKRQEEKRLLEEDIKKQDEKRINAKRNVFVNSDKEEVKGKDPETVKKNAVKMTIELQKNQVDYDTKELKRNKAAYETGMKKIQSEMVALKKNKILTDAQKQRIKELEAHSARMVHEFAASKKVYIRDAVDIEIKKKVGYKVMMSLSEFESVFKFDEMSRLVSQYGEKQNGRAIALKSLFDKLLGINAEPMELLDDKRFTMCLEKYEQLSGMTEAFKRLLKMNPDFEVGMKGEERKRLQTLDDMSSLFRVKKQILLDPSYRAKVPVDLSSYPKSKEVFAKSHYRRMLAVSKVLERNLRLAAGLPLFDNELKKQENPFAEADRLYALRLSKEPAFQNESKAGCEKLREQTSKKNQIILSKIEKIQESLKTAKGDDRDNKIGQLKELMLKSDLLNERMKKELQDDPSARIYDAIRIIEEERFQLPQDYNMIPDLLHVPEKKTGALSLTCLFQEVTNKELKAKADTNDAMCKRYGYQEFEKWMRDYAAKYFNKQYGDITFGHSKTTDPSIIYNDNLDRILTHFKGSHHLFRTDAEMREQIMALSFDRSPMRKAWQDDPEKMQYMEEMFHQKVYMLNRQMINAAARIMNGGGSRLILMTPVDKIMTMNAYLKMEILACCTSTNVIVGANYANYLEALKKNNPEEVATLDPDGYFVANMISNVPLGFHGFINMRGEKGCTDLPKAYHKEYKTFIEKYMKKHKCSSVAAGQAFMMAHPEIWDNKKAWIQPVDDKEAEESRLEEMMDRTAAQFTIPDESAELYQSDSFEPVSQKELDAYKEKIKDQGFKNYDKALDVINGGFRTMTPSEMAATYFM